MKELTTEQKAKAYDNVREKIAIRFGSNVAEEIFSEFEENEDERIRNLIYCLIRDRSDNKKLLEHNGVSVEEALAWLEKQGKTSPILSNSSNIGKVEQKSTEWNTNDEQMLNSTIKDLTHPCYEEIPDRIEEEIKWIKSMRNRVVSQPKQEWSEDDEYYYGIIQYILNNECVGKTDKENAINWFKSLKDKVQPKQKWSEEDSRILYNVKAYIGYAAGQRGVKDKLFKEANEWLNSLPIGFIYNKNYNEDMVTLLVGELKQIANDNNAPEQYQVEINWLKSLRPQSQWKPSKEQMEYLAKAITTLGDEGNCKTASILNDLRVELKKLRGE